MKQDSLPIGPLFDKFRKGDKEAFAQLVQLLNPRVIVLTNYLLPNDVSGKGIVDKIFLTAWKKRKKFKDLEDFLLSLDEITKKTCTSYAQQQKATREQNDLAEFYLTCYDSKNRHCQLIESAIAQTMGPMATITRKVLLLYYKGKSLTDISRILGIPREKVVNIRRDALKMPLP